MNRATKELQHSVVNFVSSNSLAGIWDNNHSPKCKSFICLYYYLLFLGVTSTVHATALLFVLDGKQPTLFDNAIDTGVKPTENVLFYRFKYFFHLMIACEHCNDQKISLFYYYIYYSSLPNFCLKKNPDLIGFFKMKRRHPDGLKNRSGWKNPEMGAQVVNVNTKLV